MDVTTAVGCVERGVWAALVAGAVVGTAVEVAILVASGGTAVGVWAMLAGTAVGAAVNVATSVGCVERDVCAALATAAVGAVVDVADVDERGPPHAVAMAHTGNAASTVT